MADPIHTKQFEEMGPEVVRVRFMRWVPDMQTEAIAWLSQQDRAARERADASAAEQMDLARSASAAASRANEIAEEANSIARAASASAKRSADAALINNVIAIAAAIMAMIAIVVSIIGLMHH